MTDDAIMSRDFWLPASTRRVQCRRCARQFSVTDNRIFGRMGFARVAVHAPKGWAMNIKTGEITCSEKCRD